MLQNRPCPRPRSGSTPLPAPASVDGPAARRAPRVPRCPAPRDHRASASEVAALAFSLPQAIPAQRGPHPFEVRPAV